tara:strand:- start:5162 stop:5350 length:189 start_codon:yes stop_codon:yes gene_type:complete
MIENHESAYITNSEGDTYLFEVREKHGFVNISFGDKFVLAVPPEDAFELVDALTMVLSEMRN